jgi:nucleoside-diphosphate-sugar epimerase
MASAPAMQVIVTGASGFVGAGLTSYLEGAGVSFVRLPRLQAGQEGGGSPNYSSQLIRDLSTCGTNFSAIVHLAGLAHQPLGPSGPSLDELRRVNVLATRDLAIKASTHGVRQFIYLSSVKVYGKGSPSEHFSADSPPGPMDIYGISKLESEIMLREIEAQTGMAVTIIRSPLIYGPGVKGNFRKLMRLANSHIPLPFKNWTCNRRSFIYLDNLCDFIYSCLCSPISLGKTYVVSDDNDLSIRSLVSQLRISMGRSSGMFHAPEWMFSLAMNLPGFAARLEPLVGSLRVDITKAKRELNWSPPVSVVEGLQRTVNSFLMTR